MVNSPALHYSLDGGVTSTETRLLRILTINCSAVYTDSCASDVRGKRGPSDLEFSGEFRCSFLADALLFGILCRTCILRSCMLF